MIDWITRVYHAAKGLIPDDVRHWVHNMIAGVAGIVHTVFGHVGDAWKSMWAMAEASVPGLSALASGIHWFALLVKDHWLPVLRKWASALYHSVLKYAEGVYRWAVNKAVWLEKLAHKLFSDLYHWVLKHVWDPLYAWVRDLYKKMTEWAYTAWWYITHPDKLAERLFWWLVDLVKRNIWDLARIFGEFGSRLFLANVPRVIKLIEQIMADVL